MSCPKETPKTSMQSTRVCPFPHHEVQGNAILAHLILHTSDLRCETSQASDG